MYVDVNMITEFNQINQIKPTEQIVALLIYMNVFILLKYIRYDDGMIGVTKLKFSYNLHSV